MRLATHSSRLEEENAMKPHVLRHIATSLSKFLKRHLLVTLGEGLMLVEADNIEALAVLLVEAVSAGLHR